MLLKKEVGKKINCLFIRLQLTSHTYIWWNVVSLLYVILPEVHTQTLMYKIDFLALLFQWNLYCPSDFSAQRNFSHQNHFTDGMWPPVLLRGSYYPKLWELLLCNTNHRGWAAGETQMCCAPGFCSILSALVSSSNCLLILRLFPWMFYCCARTPRSA